MDRPQQSLCASRSSNIVSSEQPSSSTTLQKTLKNSKAKKRRCLRNLSKNEKENPGCLNILHSNIQGYPSKALSLEAIVNAKNVDIVTINETQAVGNKYVSMPGFKSFGRNRKSTIGGGIVTFVKNSLTNDTLKVFEGEQEDEIVITRHGQFSPAINVINVYGSQECRAVKDKISENWDTVVNEIMKIEAKGEHICLIGDLNRHVGRIIPGNRDKVTFGGKKIIEFIESGKYKLINASDIAIGGPFTRYDPIDPFNDNKKSALDLCIVSVELLEFVDTFEIDSDRKFTPFRPGNGKLHYTDHYSINLSLKNIPLRNNKRHFVKKSIIWNTNKPGGWKTYSDMLDENENLINIANKPSDDPEALMKVIDKEMNAAKYKAFGKVKERKNDKQAGEIVALQKEKLELINNCDEEAVEDIAFIDKKLATALLVKQRESFEVRIKCLLDTKSQKGNSAAVFKLKDDIVGPKKIAQEAVVLIDNTKNEEVSNPRDIKKVSLEYCKELLRNREPRNGYEEDVSVKLQVHSVRMMETIENDLKDLTVDMFEQSYNILSKKSGEKYKFILKGGHAVKMALLKICQAVWVSERLPKSWEKTTLVQLYKGTGKRNNLNNMRHIHMKTEFPKFFGHLVVSAAKQTIVCNMSKFQIATKPGHRAQENLYVLKSVIDLYSMFDVGLVLQNWDLSKFFDKESLFDCLNELYNNGIKGKLY